MREIYLDNASTTPVAPEVLQAMLPYFSEDYGNPESLHSKGKTGKIAIDEAKKTVSDILNCRPTEIIFTGSGTESNNLAILGAVYANKERGRHIITCKIEHPAVTEPFKKLEKEGFEVTWLNVDQDGLVNVADFQNAIKEDTIFTSIMYANNEIGTIQPIAEIGEICQKNNIIFHTDACQAGAALELDVEKIHIDLMTLNGSKIYGPKGIGCLYIKQGVRLQPLIHGGGHQGGLRSGTQNTPLIIGFAKALELAQSKRDKENARLTELRDFFIKEVLEKIPHSQLNGSSTHRLPNNISLSFDDVDSQRLLLNLDEQGIHCSSGSACSSGKTDPSGVLMAIGLPVNRIFSTLRFTLGKDTTKADLDYVLEKLTTFLLHPHQNLHH